MRISDWSSDVCSSDLNVVTRRPSYTQSAEGELTVGNYGAFGVSGSYNDALGDAAPFSVYAAKRKRDGWLDVRTGNGPRTTDGGYDTTYPPFPRKLLPAPNHTHNILLPGGLPTRHGHSGTPVPPPTT